MRTPKRPKLAAPADEMRPIAAMLERELARWPDVSVRPMFGMRAFYRGTTVFAMLPDKRALENPRAIGYKLPSGANRREGEKWRLFELESAQDIGRALWHLDRAYRKAVSRKSR